jgi:2-succinyl-6-hydroxy-2,4-cyclohexadiene-1-carboxylate synthase
MQEIGRVELDDIEIEWERTGSGDRPFVLVHGFTGSRDDWADVFPALAELGTTLALDQRGHGGSTNPGTPEAYSLERLVLDLTRFLDAMGIARCDLLGHSMGGMVALRFTLAHPERVDSLVLMDTMPGPISDDASLQLLEVGGKIAREQGMETLFTALRAQMSQDPERPAASRRAEERMGPARYWERIRAKIEAMDPEAFITLGRQLTDHQSVEDRLGEIRCPTTVLVGSEDTEFLAPARRFEAGIPGARRVEISDAAHSPQIENTELWLAAIRDHLAHAREAC